MATSIWRGALRRTGHVVAYGVAVLAGYVAAGQVVAFYYSKVVAEPEGNGNAFGFFALLLERGGVAIFGLVAAVLVFVGIVGVGGAIPSQAWARLFPMILARWSAPPSSHE